MDSTTHSSQLLDVNGSPQLAAVTSIADLITLLHTSRVVAATTITILGVTTITRLYTKLLITKSHGWEDCMFPLNGQMPY